MNGNGRSGGSCWQDSCDNDDGSTPGQSTGIDPDNRTNETQRNSDSSRAFDQNKDAAPASSKKSKKGRRRKARRFRQGAGHSRYIAADIPYHVVFKTLQSRFLLRPDSEGELKNLVTGVIGRAQQNWPGVQLFAASFMSNHAHLMLQGPATAVAAFVGFIKREISRRWGPKVGWWGPMWARYSATAVITEAAQVRCLKYVLAQSVKEFLVVRPEEWPGFHCAPALMTGEVMTGTWLNATAYGRARHQAKRQNEPMPSPSGFLQDQALKFHPIPAWSDKSAQEYRSEVILLVGEIVREAEAGRAERGLPQPDIQRVFDLKPSARGSRPPSQSEPDSARRKRRLIAWDDRRAPDVKNYLRRYWRFQNAFRNAAKRLLGGEANIEFPSNAFRPGFAQARCGPAVATCPA